MGLFAPPTPPGNNPTSRRLHQREGSLGAGASIPEEEAVVTPQGQYQSFDTLSTYDDVTAASADMEAPPGSISYMMGLFAAPSAAGRQESSATATAPVLPSLMGGSEQKETTPLLGSPLASWKDSNHLDKTPKSNVRNRKMYASGENGQRVSARHIRLPSLAMPVIDEAPPSRVQLPRSSGYTQYAVDLAKKCTKEAVKPTTLIGAFMYLLYHVVFCLALGSAINRPHSSTSLLGLMTKTAALGTIGSSAVYWWFLSSEIPALYPTAVRTLVSWNLLWWLHPFSLVVCSLSKRISFLLPFLPTWPSWWTKPFLAIPVSNQKTTTRSFWQLSDYWLLLEYALVEHYWRCPVSSNSQIWDRFSPFL